MKKENKKQPLDGKQFYVVVDTSVWEHMRNISRDGREGSIEILKKIQELVNKQLIILKLPVQIKREFDRHLIPTSVKDSSKITKLGMSGDSLKEKLLRIEGLNPEDMDRTVAKQAIHHHDQACKHLKSLSEAVDKDTQKTQKEVSEIISKLMKSATSIDEDDSIWEAAGRRLLKGDPPTKRTVGESGGDAVIWETILAQCSDKDLILIVRDNGWYDGDKDSCNPHPVLLRDWNDCNTTNKLTLFKQLSDLITKIEGKQAISKDAVREEMSVSTSELMEMLSHQSPGTIQVVSSNDSGVQPLKCTMCCSGESKTIKNSLYSPLYSSSSYIMTRSLYTDDCCSKCNEKYGSGVKYVLDICHTCRRDFYKESSIVDISMTFYLDTNKNRCPLCKKTQTSVWGEL